MYSSIAAALSAFLRTLSARAATAPAASPSLPSLLAAAIIVLHSPTIFPSPASNAEMSTPLASAPTASSRRVTASMCDAWLPTRAETPALLPSSRRASCRARVWYAGGFPSAAISASSAGMALPAHFPGASATAEWSTTASQHSRSRATASALDDASVPAGGSSSRDTSSSVSNERGALLFLPAMAPTAWWITSEHWSATLPPSARSDSSTGRSRARAADSAAPASPSASCTSIHDSAGADPYATRPCASATTSPRRRPCACHEAPGAAPDEHFCRISCRSAISPTYRSLPPLPLAPPPGSAFSTRKPTKSERSLADTSLEHSHSTSADCASDLTSERGRVVQLEGGVPRAVAASHAYSNRFSENASSHTSASFNSCRSTRPWC
mmetsp:Transcript_42451/g.100963  ORF Transcript_42451/g.100963 Transcript_42451/m.100963 type:complete len:384 (-) Transcript_42451:73-1224(-)